MKIKGRSNYKPGPKDECGTPPYAVIPVLNQLEWYRMNAGIPRKKFVVWEPAVGMISDREPHMGIAEGMQALGYTVFTSRFRDFTEVNFDEVNMMCYKKLGLKIRMIMTNPPFSVALKRRFIDQCNTIFDKQNIPYALLMNTTTLVEKVNGQKLRGCAVHIPFGRICFNMPNKGWGARLNPTKATFTTNWFSKGIADRCTIHYDWFDMSDHFEALDRFYNDFVKGGHWKNE